MRRGTLRRPQHFNSGRPLRSAGPRRRRCVFFGFPYKLFIIFLEACIPVLCRLHAWLQAALLLQLCIPGNASFDASASITEIFERYWMCPLLDSTGLPAHARVQLRRRCCALQAQADARSAETEDAFGHVEMLDAELAAAETDRDALAEQVGLKVF